MCLGIPGRIVSTELDGDIRMGKVAFGGIVRGVCLEHVPEAVPGDYVLVHVGFALSLIDADRAAEIFELLRELGALDELEEAPP